MPPDVRAAYDAAQKASHDQLHQVLELSTVELEILCLHQKHGQVLTAAGRQVRLTWGSAKAGRLLWPAAWTDSKHEAQALFASARYRHASCAPQKLCATKASRPAGRAKRKERHDRDPRPRVHAEP
jgi:hypothetical protein